jgi:exosortase/archaeosortase family protein
MPNKPRKTPTARAGRPAGRDLSSIARIALACAAFWGAALWLVSRVPAVEAAGIRLTTASVRALLALTGMRVEQIGHVLTAGGTGIEIAPDCSPHLPYLIFAGAVIASPATWRQRLAGLAAGALALHAFNVARILVLFAVLASRSAWFDFAHVYLWQVGTIVAVLAAFLLWLEWTGRRPVPA